MDTYKYRFSARLSNKQLEHIKSQPKPSDYIRLLIERDIQADNHESA